MIGGQVSWYPLQGGAPRGMEGGGMLRMGLGGHSQDLEGAQEINTSKEVTGGEDQEVTCAAW